MKKARRDSQAWFSTNLRLRFRRLLFRQICVAVCIRVFQIQDVRRICVTRMTLRPRMTPAASGGCRRNSGAIRGGHRCSHLRGVSPANAAADVKRAATIFHHVATTFLVYFHGHGRDDAGLGCERFNAVSFGDFHHGDGLLRWIRWLRGLFEASAIQQKRIVQSPSLNPQRPRTAYQLQTHTQRAIFIEADPFECAGVFRHEPVVTHIQIAVSCRCRSCRTRRVAGGGRES